MRAERRARNDGSLRVPASARSQGGRERVPPTSEKPVLRLALSKGHLAIELETPFALGPVVTEELRVLLPDVRFPVDLTGGVARFRHRRGKLERLAISVDAAALADAVAAHLEGLVGVGRGPPR